MELYALPSIRQEWLKCDEAAMAGYLEHGDIGLVRGNTVQKEARCDCKKRIHRSGLRASLFAKMVADHADAEALQRYYMCEWSTRVFHLSSKKNGRPIPGAYVTLPSGWNSPYDTD